MILIDALYINYGGAMSLLRYLVEELQKEDVDFYFLVDSRCGDEFKSLPMVEYRVASLNARKAFYKQHRNMFSAVLCFGNVPPPIKMDAKVFTYLHNINLLMIPKIFPWKRRLKDFMKQRVIDFFGKNTNVWIVQTENTKNELKRHLFSGRKEVLVLPFYRLSDRLKESKSETEGRTDFALIGELSYPRGHGIILEAWKELHERGYDFTLHLTVSSDNERQIAYCNRVKELQSEGVKIINHGFIPFSEVIDIYKKSKAIVYPSLNESLGLSIIEAIEAGCDVLTADLPYAHAICQPTSTFDCRSVDSICDTIINYNNYGGKKSSLKISNMIYELINVVQ